MGFMADFGRKITEQLKTERSAPSESLTQVAANESELTDAFEEPSARSQDNAKDQLANELKRQIRDKFRSQSGVDFSEIE